MVVETINGIGNAITQTITVFLQLNNFVGENVVAIVLAILSNLKTLIATFFTVVHIALEDFSIFITECVESVVDVVDFIFGCVDATLASVLTGCAAVQTAVYSVSSGIVNSVNTVFTAVIFASTNFGQFLRLTWSSVLFLLGLAPRTIHLIITSLCSGMCSLAAFSSETLVEGIMRVQKAPAETFVGFVGAVLLVVSTRRLFKRTSLSVSQILHLGLRITCLCYFYVMKSLIFGAQCMIRLVEMTLSHLHVTRFHHAGDSDAEEEDRGVLVDESDDNENERMSDKRRNYDLLLKRRSERRQRLNRSRSKKLSDGVDTDVEEMLFEQVEREREDKLCVVCQDKEKCIMILPCRHLCICQDCQAPLQARNNHCPICRRTVRQTIKAYL